MLARRSWKLFMRLRDSVGLEFDRCFYDDYKSKKCSFLDKFNGYFWHNEWMSELSSFSFQTQVFPAH